MVSAEVSWTAGEAKVTAQADKVKAEQFIEAVNKTRKFRAKLKQGPKATG